MLCIICARSLDNRGNTPYNHCSMFSIFRKKIKYIAILKICGIIGIIMLIANTALLYLSIIHSPNFNFSENWLSDLGSAPIKKTCDIRPIVNNSFTELYFNIWLKILSILGIIFGIGLEIYFQTSERNKKASFLFPSERRKYRVPLYFLQKEKKHFSHIGAFLYILGFAFLFLIALFPQSYPITHKTTSFSAAISTIVGIILITFSAIENKKIKKLSYILIAISSFVILFVPGAIGELIIVFSVLCWTLLFGIILMRTEYKIVI